MPIKLPVDSEDQHFRYVFEYFFSALLGVLTYWVNNGQRLPTEELTALLMELWSNDIMKMFRTRIEPQEKI